MTEETRTYLKSDVQTHIWEIMQVVKKCLDDLGVEYYMLGGTLLGAVRHKGFIPWDDDIDIGIPREAYHRFLAEVTEYLPPYMEVHTWRTTPSHHYYFARIVDTRYQILRSGSEEERTEDLWIDIFPLDGMPRGWISRHIHMLRLLYNRTMYHLATFDKVNLKRPGRPLPQRIVIAFVQLTGFGRGGDPGRYLERIDRLLKKYPYAGSDWVINFMGQYMFREMFPKSWYGEGRRYPFEDSELMGPVKSDAGLTQMYGDYMSPPAEKDRNAHAASLLTRG